MKFSKYQGLENDFIVVERPEIDAILAKKLCDRRRGIGADGVLVVEHSATAPYRMTVWNADGSIAEMCGNGLRCVVRHLQRNVRDLPKEFTITTGAGPLLVRWDETSVTAELGQVTDHGMLSIELEECTLSGRLLSTGNPHFVLFGEFTLEEIRVFGPALETHQTFPSGVNVSFARLVDASTVDLTVWERGCGLTQACGTGACATVVAGWLGSHINLHSGAEVHLPGGVLEISGSAENIIMRGPAEHVFDGIWMVPTSVN